MQLALRRQVSRGIGRTPDPMLVVGYGLSLLYALVILIPLYFLFVSAFKPHSEIFAAPLGLPKSLSLENFIQAEQSAHLIRALGKSLYVVVGAELLTLLLAFPAAFAIARIPGRLASLGQWIFNLGFLIPAFAMLLPIFLMTARSGLLYNPLALVLYYPATRLSLSITLLASYLRAVPIELEENARIDGATRLQMIRLIFFPLARPGVVTVVILNFIDIWNEFLFALILLNTENRTLQIAITSLKSTRMVDYGLIAAGVVLSVIPIYIVFIFFQEHIVRGLYAGSLKG
jgi:multiple sugar transport system permease protein